MVWNHDSYFFLKQMPLDQILPDDTKPLPEPIDACLNESEDLTMPRFHHLKKEVLQIDKEKMFGHWCSIIQ